MRVLQTLALPLGHDADLRKRERAMGFEPTTFSLARRRSTTEPRPRLRPNFTRKSHCCRDGFSSPEKRYWNTCCPELHSGDVLEKPLALVKNNAAVYQYWGGFARPAILSLPMQRRRPASGAHLLTSSIPAAMGGISSSISSNSGRARAVSNGTSIRFAIVWTSLARR